MSGETFGEILFLLASYGLIALVAALTRPRRQSPPDRFARRRKRTVD